MRTTTTPTEPCGTCRAPVEVGRHALRSRHTGRPTCERCAGSPGTYFDGGPPGPRVMSDAEFRKLEALVDRLDPGRYVRDGYADEEFAARLGGGEVVAYRREDLR